VEELLIERLQALGFQVTATRFVASSGPLDAAGVFGAGIGWLAVLVLPLLVVPVPEWTIGLFVVSGVLALLTFTWGIARGALRTAPRHRADVRNIEARRGQPRVWLVAHSDSKGQGISLRTRVFAVVLTGVGTIALAAAVLVRLSGLLTFPSALAAVLPVVAGGALLSRSVPRDDSPGAVDNASGMIAVLAAAEALPARSDVGVLITGAEEFGMAGAKVWTAGAQRGERFVNVDGVDARGTVRIMVHRGDRDQRRAAARLADQLMKGFEQEGIRARIGPLPPGILVDGVVLAAAGMPGVSVSRGDWRTLGVIHTKRDTASRTDPDTAIRVGRTIAAVLGGQLG
jgi:hypothetical protein